MSLSAIEISKEIVPPLVAAALSSVPIGEANEKSSLAAREADSKNSPPPGASTICSTPPEKPTDEALLAVKPSVEDVKSKTTAAFALTEVKRASKPMQIKVRSITEIHEGAVRWADEVGRRQTTPFTPVYVGVVDSQRFWWGFQQNRMVTAPLTPTLWWSRGVWVFIS
ncbi:MAG: hypothetical protein WBD31_07815 [Rubripirellula sp.]